MRSAEEIHSIYLDRQKDRGKVVQRMEAVRDSYNGDVVVPLPEMDKEQGMYVANLLQQGLDHYGRRIASYMPELDCPPVDPRREGAKKKAETRRRATLSWWEASRVDLMMYRRARQLVGYASSPVVIRPNFKLGVPRWEPRNPLTCYPAPTIDPDDLRPDDCIFAVQKPLGWIRRLYPNAAAGLIDADTKDDKLFTVLEYDDAEQITQIVCGEPSYYQRGPYSKAVVLERVENRTGLSCAVVPGRITLDRPTGQFDGILGMLQMQAKLMALEVMAVQRGVFPDTYLISRPNETAKFISGPHPGYTGKINEIEGGDIREVSPNPGYATNPTIDRIERAARLEGGISPEFGGESGSNIRTGRRGDSILSALVDFPVAEAQKMLASSLEEENRSATQIAKAYFGDRTVSVYVKWRGAKGHLDYTPNTDFDSEYTSVTYAMVGADIQNLTIGLGQRVGTGMISKETARKLDPWIEDADLEGDRVNAESLEAAVLQSLQQKAASGEIPISDAARITELVVEDNVPLYKAVLQAQKEAQERQAAMAPESGAPPEQMGVDPMSPEAQPGLALPGQGAEAGLTLPESPPNLGRLDELMRDLRSTGPRQMAS